jgi:Protein of unknown function (DUF3551)
MRALILLSAGVLAATLIVPSLAAAQVGGQAWCMQGPTGALNCLYDSYAQCQQFVEGRSLAGACISNPAQISTTGRGGTEAPRELDAPRGTGPNSLDRMPVPAR